jgi:uncharacterized membrane protein
MQEHDLPLHTVRVLSFLCLYFATILLSSVYQTVCFLLYDIYVSLQCFNINSLGLKFVCLITLHNLLVFIDLTMAYSNTKLKAVGKKRISLLGEF